jgi:hypothetical protein
MEKRMDDSNSTDARRVGVRESMPWVETVMCEVKRLRALQN